MTESKYWKIALHLKDEEERRKFKVFRNEDVFSMYTFVSLLASCEVVFLTAALVYSLFTGNDVEFILINFIYQLVIAISLWLVWALGRRFRDHYDMMIAAVIGLI